jgi:serine/threonine protein kinase
VVRENTKAIVLEEYIEGMTVGDVLEGGVYSEEGVVEICRKLCDALTVLHGMGIIHRDIKPENIILTKNGEVKLIDFNASKEYKERKDKDTRILGTAGFAAPEQYGISQSDARTDIYAMGVLINVMLTGEHPSKVMCSGRMKKIVNRAVSINPDNRYQSSTELKEML